MDLRACKCCVFLTIMRPALGGPHMAVSMYDLMAFPFACICGHIEEITIGRLTYRTSWTCERCGVTTDFTTADKSEIDVLRDRATQIDLQVLANGQTVERIKDTD